MSDTIIRLHEVRRRTGLSRSSIYAKLTHSSARPADHDDSFPRPVRLGARAVGWLSPEIDAWLDQRAVSRGINS